MTAIWRAVLAICLATAAYAASSKSRDARGVPSDVKYIKCHTCSEVAKAAASKAQELEGKAVTEIAILDIVESICDPGTSNGLWARTIDLVERLGRLVLVQQEGEQACTVECRTLALACAAVLDGLETELAEKLYGLRKRGDVDVKRIDQWLCAEKGGLSGACAKRPPKLPRDREKGPEFKKKDEKQVEMDKIMEQLRAANGGGMNMNMFQNGMPGVDGGDANEDDDDEEEDEEEEEEDNGDDEHEEGEADGDVNNLQDPQLGDVGSERLEDIGKPGSASGAAENVADINPHSDEL